MFRKRGENLHSIFILLFLMVAFYFLEHQDEVRFAQLFAFEWPSFAAGEWWRLVTYQFTQAGSGYSFIPKPVFLFFTLLILYLMGAAIEEEWGTRRFLTFFLLSTVVSAALAALLGTGLLGSYFVRYTLLFVYASAFPEQTFYLFAVVPIRVRWLAYITAGVLIFSAALGGTTNIAVLGGAIAGYVYFLLCRTPQVVSRREPRAEEPRNDTAAFAAVRNAARFVAIRKALEGGNDAELDRLVAQCDKDVVRGVNICPPADYKPENADGYCIRCDGFAECSARYIRMQRAVDPAPAPALPEKAG